MQPWRVPALWQGGTAVIIGSGPSLSSAQIEYAFGSDAYILGIKDAYRVAPAMDLHYNCDEWWWDHHFEQCSSALSCPMVTQDKASAEKYDKLLWVRGLRDPGLSTDPTAIHTGHNSGYQAVNLCVHLGVRKICLIGFDMKIDETGAQHWFGAHPHGRIPPFEMFLQAFETIADQLEALDIHVINCTPGSALEVFTKARLEDTI